MLSFGVTMTIKLQINRARKSAVQPVLSREEPKLGFHVWGQQAWGVFPIVGKFPLEEAFRLYTCANFVLWCSVSKSRWVVKYCSSWSLFLPSSVSLFLSLIHSHLGGGGAKDNSFLAVLVTEVLPLWIIVTSGSWLEMVPPIFLSISGLYFQ